MAVPKLQHKSRAALVVKVAQRLALLPEPAGRPIRVLDCFAGDHDVWDAVRTWRTDLAVTHIDKNPRVATDLKGEAAKYLRGMRLASFDAIDLDAWGLPTTELQIVAQAAFTGPVWFTANQVGMVTLPNLVLEALGIPHDWIGECQALLSSVEKVRDAMAHYCAWLGWKEWVVASIDWRHHYGALNVERWDPLVYQGLLATVSDSKVGRNMPR